VAFEGALVAVDDFVRCQALIIRQFTGVNRPHAYYVQEAVEHGWYSEGSDISVKDVGNLLELYDIPVRRYARANIYSLAIELAQGHKVIIGLSTGDLWKQNTILAQIAQKFDLGRTVHLAVVGGIDVTDPERIKVGIVDPYTADVGARYALDKFLDAWRENDFFMVATQSAPPDPVDTRA
jgi:hypothetical protein